MARKLLRSMTPGDLGKALLVLGFVRGDGSVATERAAETFGVSPRSVQYWLSDASERRIPTSVAALIRLMVDGRIDADELGRA